MYIWSKCRLTVYCRKPRISISWGGMVPRWIGTIAGRVDPQGFTEMTLLSALASAAVHCWRTAVSCCCWKFGRVVHRRGWSRLCSAADTRPNLCALHSCATFRAYCVLVDKSRLTNCRPSCFRYSTLGRKRAVTYRDRDVNRTWPLSLLILISFNSITWRYSCHGLSKIAFKLLIFYFVSCKLHTVLRSNVVSTVD